MIEGDLVKINCENKMLHGRIGTLLIYEDCDGPVYGTCVMIDGSVYGFKKEEVEQIKKNK